MIDGVIRRALDANGDDRGDLTESWRTSWRLLPGVQQWNLVRSEPGVLRGVHIHLHHDEVVVLATGRLRLGVHDLRTWSPTHGVTELFDIDGSSPAAIVIPLGVAHGFFTVTPATLFVGTTTEYDPDDDVGIRWDDPALGFDWGIGDPLLSARDSSSPPLETVLAQLSL
jgi:dTDP-4-dehydrorhamnose 3,5-epimerase